MSVTLVPMANILLPQVGGTLKDKPVESTPSSKTKSNKKKKESNISNEDSNSAFPVGGPQSGFNMTKSHVMPTNCSGMLSRLSIAT